MTDREKRILEILAEAISNMSELEKEYLLGYGEGLIKKEKLEKELKDAG